MVSAHFLHLTSSITLFRIRIACGAANSDLTVNHSTKTAQVMLGCMLLTAIRFSPAKIRFAALTLILVYIVNLTPYECGETSHCSMHAGGC